ncbi:hypothetical protein V6245_00465 [Salinibacterium amurskyense]|uniref:hypothetical protein n=1 Tax=Salinibacterium amurskyense TaxID=205941 RepID=UPI00311E13BA
MSQESMTETADSTGLTQAKEIVARIQRLIITAALAAFGYGAFLMAGRSYCPGGFSGDGDFIDADGNVTESVPQCISLTLGPSGVIYVAIAVITILAIRAVHRRASTVADAVRYLDRAAASVVILAVASLVISYVWFWQIPIMDWDGGGTFFFPFPFGAVDVNISPMQPMP